jgi:hypothetical protein
VNQQDMMFPVPAQEVQDQAAMAWVQLRHLASVTLGQMMEDAFHF